MQNDLKQRLAKLAFVTPAMDPQSQAPDEQTMLAQQALGQPPTDPVTGQPIAPPPVDPATGQPAVDPATGQPMAPPEGGGAPPPGDPAAGGAPPGMDPSAGGGGAAPPPGMDPAAAGGAPPGADPAAAGGAPPPIDPATGQPAAPAPPPLPDAIACSVADPNSQQGMICAIEQAAQQQQASQPKMAMLRQAMSGWGKEARMSRGLFKQAIGQPMAPPPLTLGRPPIRKPPPMAFEDTSLDMPNAFAGEEPGTPAVPAPFGKPPGPPLPPEPAPASPPTDLFPRMDRAFGKDEPVSGLGGEPFPPASPGLRLASNLYGKVQKGLPTLGEAVQDPMGTIQRGANKGLEALDQGSNTVARGLDAAHSPEVANALAKAKGNMKTYDTARDSWLLPGGLALGGAGLGALIAGKKKRMLGALLGAGLGGGAGLLGQYAMGQYRPGYGRGQLGNVGNAFSEAFGKTSSFHRGLFGRSTHPSTHRDATRSWEKLAQTTRLAGTPLEPGVKALASSTSPAQRLLAARPGLMAPKNPQPAQIPPPTLPHMGLGGPRMPQGAFGGIRGGLASLNGPQMPMGAFRGSGITKTSQVKRADDDPYDRTPARAPDARRRLEGPPGWDDSPPDWTRPDPPMHFSKPEPTWLDNLGPDAHRGIRDILGPDLTSLLRYASPGPVMAGAGALGSIPAGMGGAALGGLAGGFMGAGRGNTPEGIGRGMVRGGMTGGGLSLGAGLGGALGNTMGYPGWGALAGAGLGAGGGWGLAGHLLGEPVGAGPKKREKKAWDGPNAEQVFGTGLIGAGLGAGTGLGGLAGGLVGAGQGNIPEGIGRGAIKGGLTTAGGGLGALGGALLADSSGNAPMGALLGAGLGGGGGWGLSNYLMGDPVGAGPKKKQVKKADSTPEENLPDALQGKFRLFQRGKKRIKKGDVTPEEDMQEEQPGGMPMPAGPTDVAMPPQEAPPPEGGGDQGEDKPSPEEVNLRDANSAANACAACGNFDGQGCGLLQMPVQPTQTCDAFAPGPQLSGIDTQSVMSAPMKAPPVFPKAGMYPSPYGGRMHVKRAFGLFGRPPAPSGAPGMASPMGAPGIPPMGPGAGAGNTSPVPMGSFSTTGMPGPLSMGAPTGMSPHSSMGVGSLPPAPVPQPAGPGQSSGMKVGMYPSPYRGRMHEKRAGPTPMPPLGTVAGAPPRSPIALRSTTATMLDEATKAPVLGPGPPTTAPAPGPPGTQAPPAGGAGTPPPLPEPTWTQKLMGMGRDIWGHVQHHPLEYGLGAAALGLGGLALANRGDDDEEDDEDDPRIAKQKAEILRRKRLAALINAEATGKMAMSKTAVTHMLGALIGAPLGAGGAPYNHRWEGALRGARTGRLTGALGGAGGLAGGFGGYALGQALGGGSGGPAGALIGGGLGALAGGLGGHSLAQWSMGKPSWERHEHKEPKPKSKERKEPKGHKKKAEIINSGPLPLVLGSTLGGATLGAPLGALLAPSGHRWEGAGRGLGAGLMTGAMGGIMGNNLGIAGHMVGGPEGSGIGLGAGGVAGGLLGYGSGESMMGPPSWEHKHHKHHDKEGHYPGCKSSRKHQHKQHKSKQRRVRRKHASAELVGSLVGIVKQAFEKCGCGCSTCAKCGSQAKQKVRVINGPEVRTNKGHYAWRGRNAKSLSEDPTYSHFGTPASSLGAKAAALSLPG